MLAVEESLSGHGDFWNQRSVDHRSRRAQKKLCSLENQAIVQAKTGEQWEKMDICMFECFNDVVIGGYRETP